MTTANQIQGVIQGAAPAGTEAEMYGRSCRTYTGWFTDNDDAAGDQTIETLVKLDATEYPNGAQLIAAYFAPGIAVTGHDTTNKIITFSKLAAAGTGGTTIAALTTNVATGNFVANQAKAATVTAAAAALAAGSIIAYTVTHGSTGVKTNGVVTTTAKSMVQVVLRPL